MERKTKKNNEQRLLRKRILERERYAAIKRDPQKYELNRIKERQKYLRKKEMKRRQMSLAIQRLETIERKNKKRLSKSDTQSDGETYSEPEINISEISSMFEKIKEESSSDTFSTQISLLAEFQADEEVEFGAAARANSSIVDCSNPDSRASSTPNQRPTLRVAASAPPPLPPSAHPMMWPEELTPRIRPGVNADECQIFGDFVASELRTLRSDESRKKLKRMIQKAILQIGEEEDMSING